MTIPRQLFVKKWQIVVLVLLLLVAIAVLFFALRPAPIQQEGRVCFGEQCFKVKLALTLGEQSRGLTGQRVIPENQGMLFIFDKEKDSSFWMKNMLVPLDIVWLNQNQEVIFISKNNLPCGQNCPLITPGKKAKYVLEISTGLADRIGLVGGDKATFSSSILAF